MAKTVRRLLFGSIPSGHLTATDWGLFALRVGVAVLMLFGHGWSKLAGFAEKSATFSDPLGIGSAASLSLAVFAEFFCSILIGLGLFTRFAALSLVINMAVAAFIVHDGAPWAKQELAVIYLVMYVAILFTGAGRLSLDRRFGH